MSILKRKGKPYGGKETRRANQNVRRRHSPDNERKNRVLPEQNMDEDVTFLSVRHPSFGTIRRLFNKEVTMNSCYDCILI